MKQIVLAIAFYVTVVPSHAAVIQTFGLSEEKCSDVKPDASHRNWVGGFVSGLNVMNPKHHGVGVNTEFDALFELVVKECQSNPSIDLLGAAYKVYRSLEKTGR